MTVNSSALRVMLFIVSLACGPGISICLAQAKPELKTSINPKTKLQSWLFKANGFHLELTQRLPDQNRAFFMSRGFNQKLSNVLGTSCIFKTVIQNKNSAKSKRYLVIKLNEWRLRYNKKNKKMHTREYWAESFIKKYQLDPAKSLVLQWALYPTVNRISPGDYNWGMSSFGLKPGSRFDLTLSWSVNKKPRRYTIKNMSCPPDKDRL